MAFTKEKAFDLLQKAFVEHRLGHAYLITGSSHSGVEALSEEVASLILKCGVLHLKDHPDFYTVEPESKSRKILTEQIRHLEEALHLKSQVSDYKIAVIHDADRMMPAAANAFLKTLEEPPDKTLLLLVSSLPEVLLRTIKSRCIVLPLYSTTTSHHEEHEKKMMHLMDLFFKSGQRRDATAAFQLTRSFQALLATVRKSTEDSAAEEFNFEKKHYSKTTEGSWETRRQEYFKATAEAEALQQRSKLLDVITDYFGQQLRAEYTTEINTELREENIVRLLHTLEAVESLRTSLEIGLQEALALEAGFLKIMQSYA